MTAAQAARVLAVVVGALVLAACGSGASGASGAGPGAGPGAGAATGTSSSSASSSTSGTTGCLPGGGRSDGPDGEALGGVVGLTEAEAVARAESLGLTTRVAGRGEECFALTMDLQPDRLNLDLDADGVVRGASRG